MSNAVDRLKLAEAVLALIEQKRAETGDERLGAAIERVILDCQFQELEAEILENPGAIEPWLIRRRRLADSRTKQNSSVSPCAGATRRTPPGKAAPLPLPQRRSPDRPITRLRPLERRVPGHRWMRHQRCRHQHRPRPRPSLLPFLFRLPSLDAPRDWPCEQSRYSHCIGRHRIHARNAKMARAPACGRPFSAWLAAAGCLNIGFFSPPLPAGKGARARRAVNPSPAGGGASVCKTLALPTGPRGPGGGEEKADSLTSGRRQ